MPLAYARAKYWEYLADRWKIGGLQDSSAVRIALLDCRFHDSGKLAKTESLTQLRQRAVTA